MTEPIDALVARYESLLRLSDAYSWRAWADDACAALRQRPATVPRVATETMLADDVELCEQLDGPLDSSCTYEREMRQRVATRIRELSDFAYQQSRQVLRYAAHPQADEAQRAMPPGPTSSASTAAAEGAVGSAGTHAELCASSSVVAHMRYLAYDPCANGYQPIFPRTLREWADRIESLARQVAERDAEIARLNSTHIAGGLATAVAERNEWKGLAERAEAAAAENANLLRCVQREIEAGRGVSEETAHAIDLAVAYNMELRL